MNSGQRLSGSKTAQQGVQSDQEKHCSACFDLLKDPLTLPCGHSCCMSCVKSHCDEENQKESHSCPQCGHSFTTRPGPLEKPQTGCQAAPGPADVACDVTAAVSGKPQESPNEDQTKMLPTETKVDTLQPEDEPKTRAEFLQYLCEITWDPNTASECLILSEGNRKATKTEEDQVYPGHPDRFITGSLVLSKESLTGRHYWEVERSGSVSVAVTYKDISRTGTESIFGSNYKSWALDCFDNRFVVRHVYITAAKPHPMPSRVGVYLDHRAGILSFHSVSESMTLLHRVQTTFTQPLHAGLWLHGHKSAALLC